MTPHTHPLAGRSSLPRGTTTGRNGIRRARRGAGLVEILLAMMIFALIATSYAAVTLRYATRMKVLALGASRSAAIAEYTNRLAATPYDSLSARAGTFLVTSGSFPNTRVIRVVPGATSTVVTVILTPANTAVRPDTMVLTRSRASTTSPLG